MDYREHLLEYEKQRLLEDIIFCCSTITTKFLQRLVTDIALNNPPSGLNELSKNITELNRIACEIGKIEGEDYDKKASELRVAKGCYQTVLAKII